MVKKNTEPTIITTTPAIVYGRRFTGKTFPPEELLAVVPAVEIESDEDPLFPFVVVVERIEEDWTESAEELVVPEIEVEVDSGPLCEVESVDAEVFSVDMGAEEELCDEILEEIASLVVEVFIVVEVELALEEVFPELVVELVWLVELSEVSLVWVVEVAEVFVLVVVIVELVWLEVVVLEFVVEDEKVVEEVDEMGGIELEVTLVVEVLFVVVVKVENEVE